MADTAAGDASVPFITQVGNGTIWSSALDEPGLSGKSLS